MASFSGGMGGDGEKVDLDAFLGDLTAAEDAPKKATKKKGSFANRKSVVKMGGVTDVHEIPSKNAVRRAGRGRKRDPVTQLDVNEALKTAAEAKAQGVKGLVKALQKHAASGANDETAASICDALSGEILGLEDIYEQSEEENLEVLYDIGVNPVEHASGLPRRETQVRDELIKSDILRYILKAVDKECEPRHLVSFLRLLALCVAELAHPARDYASLLLPSKGGAAAELALLRLKAKAKKKNKKLLGGGGGDGDDDAAGAVALGEGGEEFGGKEHQEAVRKARGFLHVNGNGRAEEVLRECRDIVTVHAERAPVVAYAFVVLAATARVLGHHHVSLFLK
jgi:hypothetical protein